METKEKKSFWSKIGGFFKAIWESIPVILVSILVVTIVLLLLDSFHIINLPFNLLGK